MGYNGVPPRWEEYSKIGKLIPGTKIVPFKVPLREEICRNLTDSKLKFTVPDLVKEFNGKKLTLVIDLTQTKRFYNSEELKSHGIQHVKMSTRGGGCIPQDNEVKNFCQTIDGHLKNNPDSLVGVHCTHGLNRTGYFICRYMIDYLGIPGAKSVELFEDSRGHKFDRDNYRESLIKSSPKLERKDFVSKSKSKSPFTDTNSEDVKAYKERPESCRKFFDTRNEKLYNNRKRKSESSINHNNYRSNKLAKHSNFDDDRNNYNTSNSDEYDNNKEHLTHKSVKRNNQVTEKKYSKGKKSPNQYYQDNRDKL